MMKSSLTFAEDVTVVEYLLSQEERQEKQMAFRMLARKRSRRVRPGMPIFDLEDDVAKKGAVLLTPPGLAPRRSEKSRTWETPPTPLVRFFPASRKRSAAVLPRKIEDFTEENSDPAKQTHQHSKHVASTTPVEEVGKTDPVKQIQTIIFRHSENLTTIPTSPAGTPATEISENPFEIAEEDAEMEDRREGYIFNNDGSNTLQAERTLTCFEMSQLPRTPNNTPQNSLYMTAKATSSMNNLNNDPATRRKDSLAELSPSFGKSAVSSCEDKPARKELSDKSWSSTQQFQQQRQQQKESQSIRTPPVHGTPLSAVFPVSDPHSYSRKKSLEKGKRKGDIDSECAENPALQMSSSSSSLSLDKISFEKSQFETNLEGNWSSFPSQFVNVRSEKLRHQELRRETIRNHKSFRRSKGNLTYWELFSATFLFLKLMTHLVISLLSSSEDDGTGKKPPAIAYS